MRGSICLKLTPRFSRQLQPIFEAAAKALENEEKLVFGKVDCDNDGAICKEFMVNKVIPRFIHSILLLFSLSSLDNLKIY